MVMADRLSDKTPNTKLAKRGSKKHRRKRKRCVPDEWNPTEEFQLKYDEMISQLILPVGYIFWGCYFRWIIIPGHKRIRLRVQRIARKKGKGYETHAIMCQEGIPYLKNTVDFFLYLMRKAEKCDLEEIKKLEDKEKSYFQWLKAKMAEELNCMNVLNLSLKNTAEEISMTFIKNKSRQFFQNSSLNIRDFKDLTT